MIARRSSGLHVYGRAVFVPLNGDSPDVMRVARVHAAHWREIDGSARRGPARAAVVVNLDEHGPVGLVPEVLGVEALRRAARHPGTSPRARRALNRWRRALRVAGRM